MTSLVNSQIPLAAVLLGVSLLAFVEANEGARYNCNSVSTSQGISSDESLGNVGMDSRNASTRVVSSRRKTARMDTTKCNNSALNNIIKKQSITTDLTQSKRNIYKTVLDDLNIHVNVICARCEFSYVSRTTMYCQHTLGDIICYAFREN